MANSALPLHDACLATPYSALQDKLCRFPWQHQLQIPGTCGYPVDNPVIIEEHTTLIPFRLIGGHYYCYLQ